MKTTTTLGNARPLVLALCLWLLCGGSARSQEFTVSSFRLLPNDVSAFVNSVRDLNDEACALVKVEAPSDFAFSTPLGIVKRKDEVGEIWLYLPQGTKMLTLKHPVWGVLRDYQLGTTLESRMTYELKVDVPRLALAEHHDTIVQVRTIIDTVTVTQSRPKEPWTAYALATIGAHDNGPSYGRVLLPDAAPWFLCARQYALWQYRQDTRQLRQGRQPRRGHGATLLFWQDCKEPLHHHGGRHTPPDEAAVPL